MRIKPMFDLDIFIAIMTRFYMDDFLDSIDLVAIGKRKKENMIKALKLGGFQLIKWKSNHTELNDITDDPSLSSQVQTTESNGPAEKNLRSGKERGESSASDRKQVRDKEEDVEA